MTVSKTTTQDLVHEFIERKVRELAIGSGVLMQDLFCEFADSLTAELQKENTKLSKALVGVRECAQCGALCELHAELSFEALSGNSLENTAGPEKENARLREALEKADLFWNEDDTDQSYDGPDDILDAAELGEVVEIERARRLTNIFGVAVPIAQKEHGINWEAHYFDTLEEAEKFAALSKEKE